MKIRDDKLDALIRPWMTEALKDFDVNHFDFKGGEDYSGDDAIFVTITLNDGADTLPYQKENEIFLKIHDLKSEFDDERYVYVKINYVSGPRKYTDEETKVILEKLQETIRKVPDYGSIFHQ